MDDVSVLLALADRVEGLDGADREIDHEIAVATGWQFRFEQHDDDLTDETWISPDGREEPYPLRYTGSMDAAKTLIPADTFWQVGNDGTGPDPSAFTARIFIPAPDQAELFQAIADTPELALTAASLKARASILRAAAAAASAS